MDLSKVFTSKPEPNWRIGFSFNASVDFCVWVLEIDGLRVPRFDQHPEGSSILQNKGLDADSWRKWLTTVVALQDPILLWHEPFQEQSSRVEEGVNELNSLFLELKKDPRWSNAQINLPALRSNLESCFSGYEQQYQRAVAQVSHIPGNLIDCRDNRPADVFLGSSEVKEVLVLLWERYNQIYNQERTPTPYRGEGRSITGSTNKLWGLEYLNIYQVKYPTQVEYVISPVSLIVSLANNLVPHSDSFDELIQRTAMRLAEIND